MRLYHYRCRAEIEADVDELVKILPPKYSHTVKVMRSNPLFPDVVVDIITPLMVDQLRDVMRKVADGHVMVQTVAPLDYYTGERDFSIT
ncbi:MAG: hypothetical protein HOD11_10725 [Candidatus Marinimicrobia bacterium]|jgi:hypothetical protein|nr:hypothetical protein [Candidatus Neomarinimicrobiota bacterium]MBT5270637.1 hypothetical protein [Candidatus Neomarinimicrobiota bacterium]